MENAAVIWCLLCGGEKRSVRHLVQLRGMQRSYLWTLACKHMQTKNTPPKAVWAPVAAREECFKLLAPPAGQACPSSLCPCVSKAKAADADSL